MFTQIGFTDTEAKVRAQTVYSVRLGWFFLASHKSSERLAETQIANIASCRLVERMGMRLERTVERFGAKQGIFTT
ncbi:MAG: hypothetical protein AB4368_12020 [Xenococcaceae cyanobacterium]